MAPDQQFDVSAKERGLILRRAELRESLRREFLKQATNPHRQATGDAGYVFDPAIQRFMSMNATRYDYFKPTFGGFGRWLAIVILPIVLFGYALKKDKMQFEAKCRRGEISYRDRMFKFNG